MKGEAADNCSEKIVALGPRQSGTTPPRRAAADELAYMIDLIDELRVMAERSQNHRLAHLLDVAGREAAQSAGTLDTRDQIMPVPFDAAGE